jgi:uncharacterized membrane protein
MRTTAFKLIVLFGIVGMIFSGYLTYYNYFVQDGCHKAIISCGGGGSAIKIFGQPSCVYGFGMFTIMAILGMVGVSQKRKGTMLAALLISIAGTLFSGTLSVLELWFRTPRPSTPPACVYGGIIYLALMITSIIGWRSMNAASQTTNLPPSQTAAPTV